MGSAKKKHTVSSRPAHVRLINTTVHDVLLFVLISPGCDFPPGAKPESDPNERCHFYYRCYDLYNRFIDPSVALFMRCSSSKSASDIICSAFLD